jgi:hypothetical protein
MILETLSGTRVELTSNCISLWHWQLNQLQKVEDALDDKAASTSYLPSTFQDPWYDKLSRLRNRALERAGLAEESIEHCGRVILWTGEVVTEREYILLQESRDSLGGGPAV